MSFESGSIQSQKAGFANSRYLRIQASAFPREPAAEDYAVITWQGHFSGGLPVPGPEFVERERVGGASFYPCFLACLDGICFGAADHPGTVTLDER